MSTGIRRRNLGDVGPERWRGTNSEKFIVANEEDRMKKSSAQDARNKLSVSLYQFCVVNTLILNDLLTYYRF